MRCRPSAPPRTRGSTRNVQIVRPDGVGSPAHAGIDPIGAPAADWLFWLPRARGDRPKIYRLEAYQFVAPPRTRGSTLRRPGRRGRRPGSPAHAGIDPACAMANRSSSRLPRARGDRPFLHRPDSLTRRAPPRTRGSTPLRSRRGVVKPGSPAHAGIDPGYRAGADSVFRLPRARGDRPRCAVVRVHHDQAPPRTRGSTLE